MPILQYYTLLHKIFSCAVRNVCYELPHVPIRLSEHSEQCDKRLLAPEVSMWHSMCCTDASLNWPELVSVWLKWVQMSAFGLDCSRKVKQR
jgi:hypothetical protein